MLSEHKLIWIYHRSTQNLLCKYWSEFMKIWSQQVNDLAFSKQKSHRRVKKRKTNNKKTDLKKKNCQPINKKIDCMRQHQYFYSYKRTQLIQHLVPVYR